MTPQEAAIKAQDTLKTLDIKSLCDAFEQTNGNNDPNVPTVRGWLIDELERRDPQACEAWIECEDPEKMDYPSLFFA